MQRPRIPSNFSESLHRQLNMYALAASAAGVGVLALSHPTEGEIVYTPADVIISSGGMFEYNLDLNHDGVTDFVLYNTFSCDFGCFYNVGADPQGGNAVDATGGLARALFRGARIGPHEAFSGGHPAMVAAFYGSHGSHYLRGHWINVRNRYLGLRFNIGGTIHFGWARLSVKVSRGSMLDITARLTGYAYETIPNKPIIAGKTKGPDECDAQGFDTGAFVMSPIDTPHRASLGLLAMGSPALSIWRRKESVAATH